MEKGDDDVNNSLHSLFKHDFSVEIEKAEYEKMKTLQDLLDLTNQIIDNFDNNKTTSDSLKQQFDELIELNKRNKKCIESRIIYKYNCYKYYKPDKKGEHDRAIKWTFIYEKISNVLIEMLLGNLKIRINEEVELIEEIEEEVNKEIEEIKKKKKMPIKN